MLCETKKRHETKLFIDIFSLILHLSIYSRYVNNACQPTKILEMPGSRSEFAPAGSYHKIRKTLTGITDLHDSPAGVLK